MEEAFTASGDIGTMLGTFIWAPLHWSQRIVFEDLLLANMT